MKVFSRNMAILFLSFTLTAFGSTDAVYAVDKPYEDHHDHKGHGHEEWHEEEANHDNYDDHGHNEKDAHKSHDDHGAHDGHEGHNDHEDQGKEGTKLDEEARSMIQLQTEKVGRRKLGGQLKVYGKIAQDTENYSYVTFEGDGRVDNIHVGLGTIVDKGDFLISIRRDDGTIEKGNSDIHGMILSIFVKPHDRVDRLTSLLSIVDVDTMRATVDIYEKDLRYIQAGQKVYLTTSAFPDKQFEGEVVYISPKVDEHTQSIKVRVDIKNPEHLLRLGMFVSGDLVYGSDKTALAVPVSAVQQLNGENIVFVAHDGENLKLKEVALGQISDGYVEVIRGLEEGDIVVTKGSFYLKSEQAKESFGHGHAH
ncbi:MAG: efflux RND transporter periplasmic adaptor subunit [Candidatus Omnitrophica bacterium]|nr:efflux RND transporter periplasmic adaptor subunit [Candidatus Omnitrophota bacterium]